MSKESYFATHFFNTTQGANNYEYDAIGRKMKDISENITSIDWTPTDKIRKVVQGETTYEHRYDALGWRVKSTRTDTAGTHITHYVRDASGNILGIYENDSAKEVHIYGSTCVGSYVSFTKKYTQTLGFGRFELTNHLGSVSSVVSDNKHKTGTTYTARIISQSDYYAYGWQLSGRIFAESPQRHGYQGSEKSPYSNGNYTTFYRELDTRNPHWWSIDPKFNPSESPYVSMGANPVWANDVLGDVVDMSKLTHTSRNAIAADLTAKSKGYVYYVDLKGKLQYRKVDLPGVIKAADGTALPEKRSKGSELLDKIMIETINAGGIISVIENLDGDVGLVPNTNTLLWDGSEVRNYPSLARNIAAPTTNGHAINFIHELLHSSIAALLFPDFHQDYDGVLTDDNYGTTTDKLGEVENVVNRIRDELGIEKRFEYAATAIRIFDEIRPDTGEIISKPTGWSVIPFSQATMDKINTTEFYNGATQLDATDKYFLMPDNYLHRKTKPNRD